MVLRFTSDCLVNCLYSAYDRRHSLPATQPTRGAFRQRKSLRPHIHRGRVWRIACTCSLRHAHRHHQLRVAPRQKPRVEEETNMRECFRPVTLLLLISTVPARGTADHRGDYRQDRRRIRRVSAGCRRDHSRRHRARRTYARPLRVRHVPVSRASPGHLRFELALEGFTTLKRAAVPVAVEQPSRSTSPSASGALAEMVTVEGATLRSSIDGGRS